MARRKADDPAADSAQRFAAAVARLAIEPGPLLLAVSGGPDSMAMLTLAAEGMPGAILAASVDHRLRAESAEEAAMVARHCLAIGVPHAILVPADPIEGASIQAQARATRYALLAAHGEAMGASAIATAHHADDQAETFLMRAARGSGLGGLAGVRAATRIDGFPVVRPLLDWRRAELRAVVRRARVPFVDDPANHDERHDRTRFRRLLDANEWLDPPHLAAAAAALAEADAAIREMTEAAWVERAEAGDDHVRLSIGGLPRELRRRMLRHAIGRLRGSSGIDSPVWTDSANIEPLLDALEAGKKATQAGVVVSPRGERWTVRVAPSRRGT